MHLRGFAALCAGQFLAAQTGFIFAALIPIVGAEWDLSASQAGLILGAFQVGTLAAYVAVGFLLDRISARPIMVASAFLAGVGDLAFAAGAHDFASGLALRLMVGLFAGGLYLSALRYIAATFPVGQRGSATGVFVGVLVLAHSAPLVYIGTLAPLFGWRPVVAFAGAAALIGALVLATKVPRVPAPSHHAAHTGGPPAPGKGYLARYLGDVLGNRPAKRVIVAYAAHNWELFGMWGWMNAFLVTSLVSRGMGSEGALARGGTMAAVAIGIGGLGAVLGGRLSDRIGRARAASLILAVSFLCSASFGWMFAAPIALIVAVGVLYGSAALADSPSYTASLMDLVPSRSLGGAFSLQMLLGWTAAITAPVTFGAILDLTRSARLGPEAQWGIAFGLLALGPLVGIAALRSLRGAPRGEGAGRRSTK